MKVLTFSRFFPKGHPKEGQPTFFVEKIWNSFRREDFSLPTSFIPWTENYSTLFDGDNYLKAMTIREIKHHTIRAGHRFKPGDMASLRVWSDKPYRSKQIEFAQVEVKKVWNFDISKQDYWINDIALSYDEVRAVAESDGLELDDFECWFALHPKKNEGFFSGQIICWSDKIDYQ